MNKLQFMSGATKEELLQAEQLLQTINFSSNKNTVTNFLTQYEQILLEKIVQYNYSNLALEFFGGFIGSERKKAKIISNEYYEVDFDIVCLKGTYNSKFNTIKHRDVLGAIHNLGLQFNRFGDIVVLDSEIYIFLDRKIEDITKISLTKIGRVNIALETVNLDAVQVKKEFESMEIVSSSFRLDNIVSKITNKSRSKIKELLLGEQIKLNHIVMINGNKNCNVNDMISIRKYGRFIIRDYRQNKKTLKYRIIIDKIV